MRSSVHFLIRGYYWTRIAGLGMQFWYKNISKLHIYFIFILSTQFDSSKHTSTPHTEVHRSKYLCTHTNINNSKPMTNQQIRSILLASSTELNTLHIMYKTHLIKQTIAYPYILFIRCRYSYVQSSMIKYKNTTVFIHSGDKESITIHQIHVK